MPSPKKAINRSVKLSVIVPCLNEEAGIGKCILEARETLFHSGFSYRSEIIVIDNGSTDKSTQTVLKAARQLKNNIPVKLIREKKRGYGAALLSGFKKARGSFIVMVDSDGSYNFREIPLLVHPLLDGGYDLVIGSRLNGRIESGAMPLLHRWLGTPILTTLTNHLFGQSLSDSQSGFRAITASAYRRLGMKMTGMEFASEMLARSSRAKLTIAEVPITYRPRQGTSKLLPMKDAWRHLRFLLLFSPGLFFFLPGLLLFVLGTLGFLLTAPSPFRIAHTELDIHTLSVSGMTLLLGVQLLSLSLFARVYAKYSLGLARNDFVDFIIQKFQLEQGLRAGALFFITGLVILASVTFRWIIANFPSLSEIRPVIVGTVLTLLGAQIFFSSLFLSFLKGEGR